ncbi:MAG: hypothetical protein WCT40_03025 [Candidatus Magasanikbacteria bacterium]|jgi:glutaredoxin
MSKQTINILALAVFGLIVTFGAFMMFGRASAPTAGIIFYYGQECPHCLIAEEYMKNNNIEAKMTIEKKEVWHDQTNARDLLQKAHACGIATDSVGVPLLYDNGKCYSGDTDIINYFASKL